MPALVHIYDGVRTVNGEEGDVGVSSGGRETARVRVINTDNGPMSVWVSGAEYRVVAIDGYDVHQPELVSEEAVLVTAVDASTSRSRSQIPEHELSSAATPPSFWAKEPKV